QSATGSDPFLAFSGTGLTLTVLGQTMTADLAFTEAVDGFVVTVENLDLVLGSGVAFTDGSGSLTLDTGEAAASLAGELAITVPGFTYTGSVSLEIDTDVDSLVVELTDTTLTVAGQTI